MFSTSCELAAGRAESRQVALAYIDGMNLYEYVTSSPVSRVDPLGTQTTQTTQPTKRKTFPHYKPPEGITVGPDQKYVIIPPMFVPAEGESDLPDGYYPSDPADATDGPVTDSSGRRTGTIKFPKHTPVIRVSKGRFRFDGVIIGKDENVELVHE